MHLLLVQSFCLIKVPACQCLYCKCVGWQQFILLLIKLWLYEPNNNANTTLSALLVFCEVHSVLWYLVVFSSLVLTCSCLVWSCHRLTRCHFIAALLREDGILNLNEPLITLDKGEFSFCSIKFRKKNMFKLLSGTWTFSITYPWW